jgi:hypothetical protein
VAAAVDQDPTAVVKEILVVLVEVVVTHTLDLELKDYNHHLLVVDMATVVELETKAVPNGVAAAVAALVVLVQTEHLTLVVLVVMEFSLILQVLILIMVVAALVLTVVTLSAPLSKVVRVAEEMLPVTLVVLELLVLAVAVAALDIAAELELLEMAAMAS